MTFIVVKRVVILFHEIKALNELFNLKNLSLLLGNHHDSGECSHVWYNIKTLNVNFILKHVSLPLCDINGVKGASIIYGCDVGYQFIAVNEYINLKYLLLLVDLNKGQRGPYISCNVVMFDIESKLVMSILI